MHLPFLTYVILEVFLYRHFQYFFNVFHNNDVTINLNNHTEGHLGCFSFFSFTNNIVIRILVHTFFIHG